MSSGTSGLGSRTLRDRRLLVGGVALIALVNVLSLSTLLSGVDLVLALVGTVMLGLLVLLLVLLLADRKVKTAQKRALPDEWFRSAAMVSPVELTVCGLAPASSVAAIGSFWSQGLVGADLAIAAQGIRLYPNDRGQRAGLAACTVPWDWVEDAGIVGMFSLDRSVMLVVRYVDGREFGVRTVGGEELQAALDRVAA